MLTPFYFFALISNQTNAAKFNRVKGDLVALINSIITANGNDLIICPNPFKNGPIILHIQQELQDKEVTINMFSVHGLIIKKWNIFLNRNNAMLSVETLSKRIYFLHNNHGTKKYHAKVIIQL